LKSQALFQVDAFTDKLFGGNPAAVCPLDKWLSDDKMQAIAKENNLSETAFFVPQGDDYQIRWFTPSHEVALCGHATLASAHVLFECLNYSKNRIVFHSQSGPLHVDKKGPLLQMDFPTLPYHAIKPTESLSQALNVIPVELYQSTHDLMVILKDNLEVKNASPNLQAISQLSVRGVILTSLVKENQIYSRCFYPGVEVPEDPVTGSAHCVIAPFWCKKLGVNTIHAQQGARRTGRLICSVNGNRVILSGECRLYLQGTININ
jgi:PhzF family phenazine biosynthesis protein